MAEACVKGHLDQSITSSASLRKVTTNFLTPRPAMQCQLPTSAATEIVALHIKQRS